MHNKRYDQIWKCNRKTTLCYISPSRDLQMSLAVNVNTYTYYLLCRLLIWFDLDIHKKKKTLIFFWLKMFTCYVIFLNLYLRSVRKVVVTKHTTGYAVSRFHHWASGWDFGKRSGFSEFWRSDQLLSSLQMLEHKSDVYVCNLEESVIQTRYVFLIF